LNHRDLTPEQLAETYRQIFEVDKRGALILEHLVSRFSQPAKVDGGIDAVLTTYHRLGQNSVVQHVVAMINRANNVPDNEEQQ
jgi:hypothetical protein